MTMLELRHVYYSIEGRPILRDVSLSVGEQETLAVLGASGSGKSTILKIILGLARPDKGQVLVQGTDLTQISYAELVRLRARMGIVFQEGALFDSLTVGENVGYYLMEQEQMTPAEVEPRVRSMLELVGLGNAIDMMPEELSGGMKRRVAIARALVYQPRLILYDEPTTGLDPAAVESIVELINRLKWERQVTSVMVTHDLEDAAAVADYFAVIRNGEVVWRNNREGFLAHRDKAVEAFYH